MYMLLGTRYSDTLAFGETCAFEVAVDKVFRWVVRRRRL